MSQPTATKSKNRDGWQIYATAAVVCAAVSAGGYLVGLEPALARRDAAIADAAELQARREKANDLAINLADTRHKLAEANREVAGMSLRLEPALAINQRLSRLTDLAVESGLSLDEIQPGAAADGVHYQTVPILIVGAGTYPDCASFLHKLRQRFPDTSVRSFELTNPNPFRDESKATFRVEMTWHTSPVRK